MFDVVALGELLIDFTPAGLSASGMRLFEQNPGGAPANVVCALANLGAKCAFVGKVGADMHGDFLRAVLNDRGIDTSGLIRDESVFTTLAFVSLSETGERGFSFARKPGADTCLKPEELRRDILEQCRIFHFGSLSLTNEPARSATLAALNMAKTAGAIIAYDPNYRAPLWPDVDTAITQMRSVLPLVDCVKISDEEIPLITGATGHEAAATALLEQGVSCAVITLGKNGAYAASRRASAQLAAPDVSVIDTTGAGDSFWGGFLYKLLEHKTPAADLSGEQLKASIIYANAVASLCVQKRGAIPAMPTCEEVERFLGDARYATE